MQHPYINDPYLGFGRVQQRVTPAAVVSDIPSASMNKALDDEEEEVIDLAYIIEHKPKTKIVRDYMKFNLGLIKSEEDLMFDD